MGGALVHYRQLRTRNVLVWTTAEGEKIPITNMKTPHLFNAMKMTFNHLAFMQGGEPVWFNHEYCDFTTAAITAPQRLARIVVAMLAELDRRNDLPPHYTEPLIAIRNQVQPKRLAEAEKRGLEL